MLSHWLAIATHRGMGGIVNTTDGAIFSNSDWDGIVNEAGSFR